MSYAFEVPHFADFTVTAQSRRDAVRRGRAALAGNFFLKVRAAPEPDLAHGFAVDVIGLAQPTDARLPALRTTTNGHRQRGTP